MLAAIDPSGACQFIPISTFTAYGGMQTVTLKINSSIRYDVRSRHNQFCLYSLLLTLQQYCHWGQCVANAIDFRRLL
jgi:hypothetical protein